LYLRGVELSLSDQENFNLINDLEDEDKKISLIKLVLFVTSSALFTFSVLI